MIFQGLFSLGRKEEPLLFVVFDAGKPESDETCKDVDGQMAWCGRGRSLQLSQECIQRKPLWMMVESKEECMLLRRVAISLATHSCFLSPDGEVDGRGDDILVVDADVGGARGSFQSENRA